MSADKKVFVKWYYNDTEYHQGHNQVVNPDLMAEKFHRELHYLENMAYHNPDMVPKILEVNIPERKIYLQVDGPDFWEQSKCDMANYDQVLPDWQEQMLAIFKAHRARGWYKFSMHPSSYFIVDGKLKSINYFFTYHKDEPNISIADVESHIYTDRQDEMRKNLNSLGIIWDKKQTFETLKDLCWASFNTNYPADFIAKAKNV